MYTLIDRTSSAFYIDACTYKSNKTFLKMVFTGVFPCEIMKTFYPLNGCEQSCIKTIKVDRNVTVYHFNVYMYTCPIVDISPIFKLNTPCYPKHALQYFETNKTFKFSSFQTMEYFHQNFSQMHSISSLFKMMSHFFGKYRRCKVVCFQLSFLKVLFNIICLIEFCYIYVT